MTLLMRAKDYAKHRGVTPAAVSNWKRKELLVFAPDPDSPGKQLIDVAKSDLVLNGTVDQTRGRPRSGENESEALEHAASGGAVRAALVSPLQAAQLADLGERTLARRIENEKSLKALVPLAEYERRAGDMGRLVRERTVGVIRQSAERLAAETDPRQIIAYLTGQFDDLFVQLADEIEAAAKLEDGVDQALASVAADLDEDAEEAEAA